MVFEGYGNEEEIDEEHLEEVEVIEGTNETSNHDHYSNTRHLFEAPKKNQTQSTPQSEIKNVK